MNPDSDLRCKVADELPKAMTKEEYTTVQAQQSKSTSAA
jgi:hypothetical protein